MLTPANFAQQHGLMVVEPVCQTTPTFPSAISACSGFQQNIQIPPNGAHVIVTGSYVLDNEHGGWAEIHPVTSIVVSSDEGSGNINDTATEPSP